MFPVRRSAASSARRLFRQPQRRFDSSASHGHDSHHHSAPVNEGFGKGFYISIAAIPASFALYKLSFADPTSKPYISQLIEKWSEAQEEWDRRNTMHTVMIEQAAHDRNLFQSEPVNSHVEMRFQEVFNTGSPMNVPAGQGGAELSELVAHYEKKNKEQAERTQKKVVERDLAAAKK